MPVFKRLVRGFGERSLFLGASIMALSFASAPVYAQTAEEEGASEERQLGVVYVTARRTEEQLQDVPVAVSAFDTEALEKGGVQRLEDLQRVVPGFQATPSARGDTSPLYMIRGQRGSLLPSSIVDSSVSVYFDEFNLSRSVGTNQSLFDLASVQVLKGPQGTLFGRNATGGAILLTPNAPTQETEGYLKASVGNYDFIDMEGVFNTPLVEDKLALRVGGKISRRDGYLTNVLNGQVANDKDAESYRVSLLYTPNDAIESETVASYYNATGVGFAQKLDLVVPESVPIPPALPAFVAELEATEALGDYEYRNPTELYSRDETSTIQNSTTIDLGDLGALGEVTLKNIIGFRSIENEFVQDFFGGGLDVYALLGVVENDIFSEELQLQGEKGPLDYILGAYYFHEEGLDTNYGDQFSFLAAAIPSRFPLNNGYLYDYENSSLAGFLHVNYDLGAMVDGLSVSAGVRVTDDARKIDWHNQPATDPSATAYICTLTDVVYPTRDPDLCSFKDELSNTEVTYNLSVNYDVTDDVLVYLAHRRGYRAGGFNQTPGIGVPRSFDPEFVDDLELGLKSEFDIMGAPARLNLAGYYQWYKDIQRGFSVRSPSGATTNITSNAAKAHIYGLETEFTVSPTDFLDISLSHAYTEAVYDEWENQYAVDGVLTPVDISDSKFASVPEHQVSLAGTVWAPIPESAGGLSATVSYTYQSKTITTDINTSNCGPDGNYRFCLASLGELPEYDLLNLRIDWTDAVGSGADISLFANNLLDEYYTPFATNAIGTIGTQAVAVGAPRMWGVELKVPFGK